MEAKSQAVKRLEEIKDGMDSDFQGGLEVGGGKNGVPGGRPVFFSDPKVFLEESKKVSFFFLEKEPHDSHI